jgi:hypothetical protein
MNQQPTPAPATPRDDQLFGTGGGELAALIRAFDWAQTSLGPLEDWAPVVRTTVSLILRSPVPMITLWGAEGLMIYNDGYAEIAGNRHPDILGGEVLTGWPEVTGFNANVLRVGLGGGTLNYRDQHLVLLRNGVPEDAWLVLTYSRFWTSRASRSACWRS